MHHIRVGITQGDINGIGPEVVMKALAAEEIFGMAVPVVFGSSDIAASIIKECNLEGVHFTPVKSASEAREGRINLVDVTTHADQYARHKYAFLLCDDRGACRCGNLSRRKLYWDHTVQL